MFCILNAIVCLRPSVEALCVIWIFLSLIKCLKKEQELYIHIFGNNDRYETILERFKLKLSENGIYFKANALN